MSFYYNYHYYRGQLVKEEHLDGNSYQFLTVSSDGVVMVWDIRYEKIALDELRHIGRAKHVPVEKIQGKDGNIIKPLWAPIYKAPLKRIEGIGEMSLARVTISGNLKSNIAMGTSLPGDFRSHVMIRYYHHYYYYHKRHYYYYHYYQ